MFLDASNVWDSTIKKKIVGTRLFVACAVVSMKRDYAPRTKSAVEIVGHQMKNLRLTIIASTQRWIRIVPLCGIIKRCCRTGLHIRIEGIETIVAVMVGAQEGDLLDAIQGDTVNKVVDAARIAGEIDLGKKLLNVLHINIRSIKKNFDELLLFLEGFQVHFCDIIVLSECFRLQSAACFNLPDYNTYYNCSDINRNDGVIVLIRSELNVQVDNIKLRFSNVCVTMINLVVNNLTIGVSAVYRSPQTSVHSFVNDIDDFIPRYLNKNIEILIGDINIDLLDVDNCVTNDYLATLHSHGFMSYINTITRPQSRSCLDHIFMRNNMKTSEILANSYVINYEITDHDPIMLNISQPTQGCSLHNNTCKIITKIDTEALIGLFEAETWESVCDQDSPEIATQIFYDIYHTNLEACRHTLNLGIKVHKKISLG